METEDIVSGKIPNKQDLLLAVTFHLSSPRNLKMCSFQIQVRANKKPGVVFFDPDDR